MAALSGFFPLLLLLLLNTIAHMDADKDPDSGRCSKEKLQYLPIRLVDWFHVLKSDYLRGLAKISKLSVSELQKSEEFTSSKIRALYQQMTCQKNDLQDERIACVEPLDWMFGSLDTDHDRTLSMAELKAIGNDRDEPCIEPFFQNCDLSRDGAVQQTEFCRCLCVEPPCLKALINVPSILIGGEPVPLLGAFIPSCDADGFYSSTQCHETSCWCVNRFGEELVGTRSRSLQESMSCQDNTIPMEEAPVSVTSTNYIVSGTA